MEVDLKQIRELLAVVSGTDITELTVEVGNERITIKKAAVVKQIIDADTSLQSLVSPQSQQLSPEPSSQAPEAEEKAQPNTNNGLIPVTSPMVGTFYRSPSPNAPPFVDVGDYITAGQTVCIIEAMKLMNDMPSEVTGKLVTVCAENGTTVEYGQPLFMVDPKG